MTGREDFFSDTGRHARAEAPPQVSPRARFRPARVAAIAAVLAVTIGAGVVDRLAHRAVAPSAPAVTVTAVPSATVESSAWYCAGGTSAPGSTAATTIQLVNTGATVDGTLSAVSDTGTTKSEPLVVPARSQSVVVPGPLVGGKVVAATVELDGGGVLVTESVAGPLGWSEAPCSRSTAATWYFASGSTVNGGTMAISLYNPTTTDAVVDMTFVTPSGVPSQPQPFQGIVVPPGTVAVEQVDAYVQDKPSVSSIVVARTGAVVAAMLQTESVTGARGVSLRLGVPALSRRWTLPNSIDLTDGTTSITVFNPSDRPARTTVTVHPGTSPVATFTHLVGPRDSWVLETSGQGRIPAGIPFLATVRASGPGVVVDRTLRAPSSFTAPQFGAITGLSSDALQPLSSINVLAGPGDQAHPSTTDAAVEEMSVVNPGSTTIRASVLAVRGGGLVPLGSVTVAPGRSALFGKSGPGAAALRRAGRVPVVVRASGPVEVLEDLGPTATAGVVGLAGAASGAIG